MKGLKKNSLILLLATIVVLVFVLKDDFNNIVKALVSVNIGFLILAILCELVGISFYALSYKKVIDSYTDDYTFKKAFRMILITKFFNGITPFSTGGQPMQIYMLKKEGFRLTKATNIIMQTFILYQAALVTLGLFAMGINMHFHLFPKSDILKNLIVLGFLMNTLVMLMVIIVSFNNKFNHMMVNKIISLLSKLHIIKNKEKSLEEWSEKVDDFHEGATFIKQHKKLCAQGFIYNLLYLVFIYVMPFIVIIGLGDPENVNPLSAIVSSAYVLIIGSFVPIPGASGGIEYGYLQFFGYLIKGTILKASLIIWRFISYYLPMISGALLLSLKGSEKECE